MPTVHTARRRARQLRRARGRRAGQRGEDRALARLVLCGAVFVLLVAVKLLFPATVERLADSARELISRDADFKEAFAAVGRGIGGERPMSDSLQEAYAAVFNPAPPLEPEEPETDAEPAPSEARPDDAGAAGSAERRLLRHTALTLPEAERLVMRELVITPETPAVDLPSSGEVSQPEEETASAAYLYAMPAPPENASLEQRNLGFDHCTPVLGQLSSTFGWREHPVEGGNRFHYGVDLAAEAGADVVAFADGEVYAAGESSTLGNYVMLRHEGGYITLYAHCSRVTAVSGRVAMGDKIAEVGATGLATGPHLHFELHDGELYLNPIFYVQVG